MSPHQAARSQDAAGTFPSAAPAQEKLVFLLRYAVAAPSGHNTQPWRFRTAADRLEIRADRSRALPVVDPDDRALTISCGAALAFLRVALRRHGYAGEVETFPQQEDADLLATVALGDVHPPSEDDRRLFEAIARRHTHRSAFDHRPVAHEVVTQLQHDVSREGATLHPVADPESRKRLAGLVAAGDRAQFADPQFRRELADWIRSNYSSRRDGVPGRAFGIADLPSMVGPLFMRTFDVGGRQAAKDEELALASPLLMVLSTPGDTPAAWLAAGQALGVALLRASSAGLAASFLNQPVEVPRLRPKVRELVGTEQEPQLVLRLGYGGPGPSTPRRAVEEVLR